MASVRTDHRTSIVTCLLVVAIGTATGCARRGTYLEDPVGETHTTSSSTAGARPQGVDEPRATIGVVVTEELRAACGLPHRQQAARFSFDGRRLRANGDDDLAGVVRCLASDRLGDAALVIVGHTDPRGDEEYSEKLGLHRADVAREYLVERGIAHERIAIRSHGARDAKGTSEPSWALDRYVELRLAEPRSQAGMPVPQFDGAGTNREGQGGGAAGQAADATRGTVQQAPSAPSAPSAPVVIQTVPPAPVAVPPAATVNPPAGTPTSPTTPTTPTSPATPAPPTTPPSAPAPSASGTPVPSVPPPPPVGGTAPPTR